MPVMRYRRDGKNRELFYGVKYRQIDLPVYVKVRALQKIEQSLDDNLFGGHRAHQSASMFDIALEFGVTRRTMSRWWKRRDKIVGPMVRQHNFLVSVHRRLLDGETFKDICEDCPYSPTALQELYNDWLRRQDVYGARDRDLEVFNVAA